MSSTLFDILKTCDLPAPKGILQVGASYGQELQTFFDHRISNCLLIEPLPHPFSYISEICMRTPGYIAFQGLCTESSGQNYNFHVASNGGQSSSILMPDKHKELFDSVKFEESINLTSTTVDDIISFLDLNGYINTTKNLDTLYMDVQGAEFRVLLGASKTLKSINYIYTEIIRGNLYKDMETISSYCSLLEFHGFTLNNLNFNKYHHADALFVRRSLLGLP